MTVARYMIHWRFPAYSFLESCTFDTREEADAREKGEGWKTAEFVIFPVEVEIPEGKDGAK